jgi:hypothetical protein
VQTELRRNLQNFHDLFGCTAVIENVPHMQFQARDVEMGGGSVKSTVD